MTPARLNRGEVAAGLAPTPGYRYADRIGHRLYIAGQVPHDSSGVIVGIGDPAEQCRQCLRNLFVLVQHHGFGLADIHRLTIYDVGDRAALSTAWNEVVELFDGAVPPATLLGVAVLGHDHQLVEIDAEIDSEPRTTASG